MNDGFVFGNKVLDIVLVSLITAQSLKVIFSLIFERKINFRKFIDTGSMPSSHTSSVVSLATSIGILEGYNSLLFAISVVFATVVMYDSTGVRMAAGKQAALLNKIVDNLHKKDGRRLLENNLKELLGHTPLEVLGGAFLGFIIAYFMC